MSNRPEYTDENGAPNASGMIMDKKWDFVSTHHYRGPHGRHIRYFPGQGWVRSRRVVLPDGWINHVEHRTYATLTEAMQDLRDEFGPFIEVGANNGGQ